MQPGHVYYTTKQKKGICITKISYFWKCFCCSIAYMLNKFLGVLKYGFPFI